MQLNCVHFCGATSDDATESVAPHSSRLQPSVIYISQLQPVCLATMVPKLTTLRSGMKAQVGLETVIKPHDLVCFF